MKLNISSLTPFVLLFLTLPQQINAQYFAPIGAKWTYTITYGEYSAPPCPCYVKPLSIKITKDTIINSLTCRIAEIAISDTVQAKKYIRSINDSVLVYSPINNQFNLLYSFNVNIGDTLKIFAEAPWSGGFLDSSYVEIDSVGFKNINGINFRAYHQRCLSSIGDCLEGGANGWVIDSLGIIEPYYNWPFIDRISYLFLAPITGGPPNIYPLRCYTDSNTYYNYDNTNCDTTYIITGIEGVNTSNFKIYPTLLSNNNRKIIIETISSSLPKQITLVSLTGVEIPITISRYKTKTELLLNNKIPSGIYLLNFNLNNIPFTSKIIIL